MNPNQFDTFNQIWHTALAPGQYFAIVAFAVLTALSLIGFFAWALRQQQRIDPRYRVAIRAGIMLTGVAGLFYLLIIYKLIAGYSLVNGIYQPSDNGLLNVPARYIDWAITVPLLVVELIGVSALNLRRATLLRLAGTLAALGMIITGYVGDVASADGFGARVSWSLISSGFFVLVGAIIVYTVLKSAPELSDYENRLYRRAMIVLLAAWFIYPIIYGLDGFFTDATWAVAAHISYSIADVIAKVVFGLLVFKVALSRSEHPAARAR